MARLELPHRVLLALPVATPLLVAEIAPDFAEAAPQRPLWWHPVVITAIVVPVITALWAKHGASRVRAT
ncbi:hypothetical protein ACLB1M_33105 [Escherichia coli]